MARVSRRCSAGTLVAVCLAIAHGCAKSEGLGPGGNAGGGGLAGVDASAGSAGATSGGGGNVGGGAGASMGGAGGSGGGGGSGGSGGMAGAGGTSGGGGAGGTGAAGGTGGTGAAGGTGGTGGTSGTGATGGTSGTGGVGGTSGTGGVGGTSGTGATGGLGGTGGTSGTGATGGTGGTSGTGGSGGTGGFGGCPVVTFPFTGCSGGWVAAGKASDWSCGVPTSGPSGDHTTGSSHLWGTNLGGNTAFCEDSTLTSPVVDLSAYNGQALRLRFWHWYEFRACQSGGLCGLVCALDNSTYSGGIVEIYNGSSWVTVTPTTGYGSNPIECYSVDPEAGTTCPPSCALDGVKGFSGTSNGQWVSVEIDISSYAIAGFRARFHFASYANEFLCHPNKPGWYVDDVWIGKLTCP